MPYILGQICGIIATVATIIVPFYRKKWMMVVNTALINLLMALNFVLIGEIGSAAALCAVATVQCLVSLLHAQRNTSPSTPETVLFVLLYLGFGFFGLTHAPGFVPGLNARNLLELLPIVGSLFSMTFIFIRDEQNARWILLMTCAIWSVYTGMIGATTFFAQFISLVSTAAALLKYHRRRNAHS